jgi:hypothetical protein
MVTRLMGRCRSIDLKITPLLTKRASCIAPGDQNLIVSRGVGTHMVDTKCAKRIPVVVMNTNPAPRAGYLTGGAIEPSAKLLSVESGDRRGRDSRSTRARAHAGRWKMATDEAEVEGKGQSQRCYNQSGGQLGTRRDISITTTECDPNAVSNDEALLEMTQAIAG